MLLFIAIGITKPYFSDIFQYISCYCLSKCLTRPLIFMLISIHLMLLFILGERCKKGSRVEFQYISCYCLSCCFNSSSGIKKISIHLMLLFILRSYRGKFGVGYISIHLMLLFIYRRVKGIEALIGFQYISCYCLSGCKYRFRSRS